MFDSDKMFENLIPELFESKMLLSFYVISCANISSTNVYESQRLPLQNERSKRL